MDILKDFVKLDNTMLGNTNEYVLVRVKPYKRYDEVAQKSTDEILGHSFFVVIDDPEKEIDCEKLEVRIAGPNPIPQYKNGERVSCQFENLQLTISKIEYGKATIKATADGIKLVSTKEQDEKQIKGQIKLNM